VGAVDVADCRKKESPGVWDGVIIGVVEAAVPHGPLGASGRLEMMAPELNEVSCLVTFPGVAQAPQVGMLKVNPGVME
jgi:hypothetical protein